VSAVSGIVGGASGGTARLAPLSLKTSAKIRLQRRWPRAVFKEEIGQIVVPVPRGADPAEFVIDILSSLVPVENSEEGRDVSAGAVSVASPSS
jgi:hypothetical protein